MYSSMGSITRRVRRPQSRIFTEKTRLREKIDRIKSGNGWIEPLADLKPRIWPKHTSGSGGIARIFQRLQLNP